MFLSCKPAHVALMYSEYDTYLWRLLNINTIAELSTFLGGGGRIYCLSMTSACFGRQGEKAGTKTAIKHLQW